MKFSKSFGNHVVVLGLSRYEERKIQITDMKGKAAKIKDVHPTHRDDLLSWIEDCEDQFKDYVWDIEHGKALDDTHQR